MNRTHLAVRSTDPAHRTNDARPGFTLTEVVLTMAIVASALMAVIALLPAGMDVSRNAMNQSVVATILEDVNQRLQGQVLAADVPEFSPAFFDEFGVLILPDALNMAEKRVYRADITIVDKPPVDPGEATDTPFKYVDGLRFVNIKLSWPLGGSGQPIGNRNPRISATYGITTLSGPDWKQIDDSYEPKIGL